MTTFFVTAFVMGGIGSLHCIGMCGPLALSLPVISDTHFSRFVSTFLYNIGRVTTYAFLGAVFGVFGSGFALLGYQQILSVALGVAILLSLLLPATLTRRFAAYNLFIGRVRHTLSHFFSIRKYQSVYFIGLLNGLLPCGMVYMAIAGAISTGSVLKSSVFMALFGLGTLPVMWGLAFFGSFINLRMRQSIRRLYPYAIFLMAALLILRGSGLHVPFISPGAKTNAGSSQVGISCHE